MKNITMLTLAAALLAGGSAARAAESSAAQFLRLGFGARALGMGEAFTPVADDAAALYYNPAGLGTADAAKTAMFSHAWHIQDTGVSHAALASGPWGFGVTYFSAGDMEGRDENQVITGNFTARDLAFTAGRSFDLGELDLENLDLGGLRAGLALKYIDQKISDYSARSGAADLGLLYRYGDSPLKFGASLSNLGTRVKFRSESFPLPLTLRAGASAALKDSPLLLSAQVDLPNDDGPSLRLGGEYTLNEALKLRMGYKTSSSEDRDAILGRELGGGATGVSSMFGFFAGIGLTLGNLSLDYAITPYGELGSAHRVAVVLKL